MNRELYLKEIIATFEKLESLVKLNNSAGLTDINKISEDFFCHLLNKIFDLKFINLNLEQSNHPAVDLGDDTSRISIQVTADRSGKKVKECVKKFKDHGLEKRFDKLRIVVISTGKTSFKKNPAPGVVFFDYKNDVVDLSDLTRLIGTLSVDRIEKIRDFLNSELNEYKRVGSANTISNEVGTIAAVIGYLTSNKIPTTETWTEEPDPEKKIEHRFSEHSDYLKKEIIELFPRYAEIRKQVDATLGIDSAATEHLRTFLRSKSNDLLTKADNNPGKALADLTSYLEEKISASGTIHDQLAIRYFVLDELIRCNVFPN
ncbi:MAG: SMEK domain-containing protein [bacterium]|nr:SMEK domain-containing protein [bacterium]